MKLIRKTSLALVLVANLFPASAMASIVHDYAGGVPRGMGESWFINDGDPFVYIRDTDGSMTASDRLDKRYFNLEWMANPVYKGIKNSGQRSKARRRVDFIHNHDIRHRKSLRLGETIDRLPYLDL